MGFITVRTLASRRLAMCASASLACPSQTLSVAAALASGVLTSYRDTNGYTIALAEPGVVSAETLFPLMRNNGVAAAWILRGVGFVLVLIGFVCVTRPLTMLFAVLPFLESLVGAGAFLVALTLAIPVTLLTISIAWIVHRPLIGGLLLQSEQSVRGSCCARFIAANCSGLSARSRRLATHECG